MDILQKFKNPPSIVIEHPREVGELPLKIKLFLDDQHVKFHNNVLKGLINHSAYFQTKILNAMKEGEELLGFPFTSDTIHEVFWLKFFAGYLSPEFFIAKDKIDLVQLIAACHCFAMLDFLITLKTVPCCLCFIIATQFLNSKGFPADIMWMPLAYISSKFPGEN